MHNIHPHPKFSIITVTYNAEKVLEDTIQSIVTQSYKNVEYIIVDGGSTDGTLTIVNKYKEHIHTIVSEPDKGLYDAMNKGIKLATGDYLCFLNAGDGLHEDDTLLRIVHSLTGTILPDVIYGETDIVDDEGHFLYKRRLSAPETLPLFQGASVGFRRLAAFHGLPAGSRTLPGGGHARNKSFPLQNRLLWAYGTYRSIKARPRLCSPPLRR